MSSYLRDEIVLIQYPFSDHIGYKIRPAVIINAAHSSRDHIIVPLTSRVGSLLVGEFLLQNWKQAGLNVPTAVKRGIYTVHENLILQRIGNQS